MQSLSTHSTQSWLSWFFKGLLFLAIVGLLGRLIELQVIKGAYYRNLAENNRIRRVPITAPRGKILARGGEILVDNEEIKKTVQFDPQDGIEKRQATPDTPEDEVIVEWSRTYTMGADLAHVTGYLGEVNAAEVKKVDSECTDKGARKLGSLIGRGGLEEQYECALRGIDGEELVEVDTLGRKVRTIGRRPAQKGADITITIDLALQKKVAAEMNGKKGAVVITDGLGEILALYSSPSFDPNVFVQSDLQKPDTLTKLFTDSSLPLFNRAIAGAFHPGSIYKIVTATAALEEGDIDKAYTYEDTGIITVNDFSYSNWYLTQYGGVEGIIDITRALARSTDTFFYKVGEIVGPDKLVEWSKKFGLGEKTGIDLPGEIAGLVPSPEWKKAIKGERWYLGNTYHMSIGQGDLTVTPVGSNASVAVIASDGKWCIPHLLMAKKEQDALNCRSLNLKRETIDLITKGMTDACSPGGTGVPFFDFEPQVACKTGTAETGENTETDAWFTVFAPADKPQIVVTVLVEKGGEGSKVAAPIAREIINSWSTRINP